MAAGKVPEPGGLVNAGGIVLLIAGVWVLTQVLGGEALERLRVVGGPS